MADVLVLEADGIGVSFGQREVLRAAGLRLRAGGITALLGRNGEGKTTLFRVAAGLLRADQGWIRFRGRTVLRPRLARLAQQGLLYSSQEASLAPGLGVREHLEAYARRWDGAGRLNDAVERMRLGEWLEHRAVGLSGGERQRLSLALALVRAPACLLADEPFAGVAPRDREDVADAIRDLADTGCAVAVSGHDVDDLFGVSDQVIWMTAGTTRELGTPEEARESFEFRRGYLGPAR